jgi:type I restriction enzyme M protein
MITGELKSQIDQVWDHLWSNGLSNPLDAIEQITFLLFLKRLDEQELAREALATRERKKIDKPIFSKDERDKKGEPIIGGQLCRWHRFKQLDPGTMWKVVANAAFPFMKNLGGVDSSYTAHMTDATFKIPERGAVLSRAVDMLDKIKMDDRDTKGDVYEYLINRLSQAGLNGQFRTPRHIIKMMVELVAPRPTDIICDPACGTAGFLVYAGEYLRQHNPKLLIDDTMREHFLTGMFHGYDNDAGRTMHRISVMNLMLHGIENPHIEYRNALGKDHDTESDQYTLVLANPPFKGGLDETDISPQLTRVVKTKKTELLFMALFLRLLKTGGRAAVIVPDGVLFGASNAHRAIRKELIENQKLDAVISMPSGVFKPYAGVSTAVLVFTKTNSGGTDHVWFYDMEADGKSLDDKRTDLLPEEKLGPTPLTPLSPEEHAKNNLPDVVARWKDRDTTERTRPRTAQSFCVPRADIIAQGYDLSINRYKEVVHEEVNHRSPKEILAELGKIEQEIVSGMKELEGMLG